MNNTNPIYLTEDHFLKKLGNYLVNDAKYTKQRWFGGKGRKYVNLGRKKVIFDKNLKSDPGALNDAANTVLNLDIEKMKHLKKPLSPSQETKYARDIDNYVQSMDTWNKSRSEFGDEVGSIWDKIKSKFRRNKNPPSEYNFNSKNDSIIPYALAGTLGILGFDAATDAQIGPKK